MPPEDDQLQATASGHPLGNNGQARSALWMVVLVLLLQVLSRYGAYPVADHTADAWPMLAWSRAVPTYTDTLSLIVREPDRPLQASILTSTFKLLDDNPTAFAFLSIAGYSLWLLLILSLVQTLTRSTRTTLLAGVILCLLPNLYQSFHWGAMIAVIYMQVAYVAAVLGWVRYQQSGHRGWWMLSAAMYGVGITSYEFGAGLPAVMLLLSPPGRWRKAMVDLVPHALLLGLYLLWRFTKGFGMAEYGVLFPPRDLDLTVTGLLHNAQILVGWWIGTPMLDALRNGLNGYATIGPWIQRVLFAANLVAVAAVLAALARSRSTDDGGASPLLPRKRILAAMLAWWVLGHAPSLVSWGSARLNLFPAIGLAIAVAILLTPWPWSRLAALLTLPALVLLPTNQGSAKAWHDAGRFQRNLYQVLEQTQPQWEDKDVILLETASLRSRQTPSILTPPSAQSSAWAFHRNASLVRGFVPRGMIEMIARNEEPPMIVLDAEHEIRLESETLVWSARWNPDQINRTPMEKVFRIALLDAGQGTLAP